jgi:hypothetical protein
MAHATPRDARDWPTGAQILLAAVAVEALLIVAYFLGTESQVTTPRYVVYPFVWINVAVLAAIRVEVTRTRRRYRWIAAAVAGGYFLLLANFAGLIGLAGTGHHPVPEASLGLTIGSGSPGWQRVRFITDTFFVAFVPYRVIGYVGLAYLVYAAVLDATSAALTGAIGLVSCISCSFPIVAAAVASVWGGTATLMSTVYAHSIDISTVTFLVSVALLYWRPGFPSLGGSEDEDAAESGTDGESDAGARGGNGD